MCDNERMVVMNPVLVKSIKDGALVEISDGVTAMVVKLPGDDLPCLVLTPKSLRYLADERVNQAKARLRERGLKIPDDES